MVSLPKPRHNTRHKNFGTTEKFVAEMVRLGFEHGPDRWHHPVGPGITDMTLAELRAQWGDDILNDILDQMEESLCEKGWKPPVSAGVGAASDADASEATRPPSGPPSSRPGASA